jgi:predicted AlkP superfamily pyrophosphatase or phosphodiesterase
MNSFIISKNQFLKSTKLLFVLCLAFSFNNLHAQNKSIPAKPKLVIGIVVDQMRWDFLYKYSDRYSDKGFKRLLSKGFSVENGFIPYAPTVTAAGHTCAYTGSVPAINGIAGNDWYDRNEKKVVYCASDTSVSVVGVASSKYGEMSPKNMWSTSISDELRVATNFKGKSVGVCIKDRGAIFPAGHTANAAYWYDSNNGKWISSSYYMDKLSPWLQKMNDEKFIEKYYKQNWTTLYPKETYTLSAADEQIYEGKFKGNPSSSFPYKMENALTNYSLIASSPHGNTMTLDVAKQALINHELGKDDITDILCVSFSSPDYIGHQFGPNSVEIEDNYLRLDRDMGDFLSFLDKEVGDGNYTIFLTADHGVAHVPGFLKQNKIPGSVFQMSKQIISINDEIKNKFGIDEVIITEQNNQLSLNYNKIREQKLDSSMIEQSIINLLMANKEVLTAFRYKDLNAQILPISIKEKLANGYTNGRCGEILVLFKTGYVDTWITGTTHGSPYAYDTHIPILFYGWGIKTGKGYKTRSMSDIAPTIASLLQIPTPSGSIGNCIEEAIK